MSLNKNIQREIINFFDDSFIDVEIDTFIYLIHLMKELRNLTSHNERIYKFSSKEINPYQVLDIKYKNTVKKKIKVKVFNDLNKIRLQVFKKGETEYSTHLNLWEIINIISFLNNNNNLLGLIKREVLKLKKSIYSGYPKSNDKNENRVCEGNKKAWFYIINAFGFRQE